MLEIPAGKLDKGENPDVAAIRELRSSENIVIGMALKHAADFIRRGIRMDSVDAILDSIDEQKDEGHFLMDDLTLEYMRSDEFFSDDTMDTMGEFKESPSMLELAQAIIVKVKAGYTSPVPADAQARIRAYFEASIYPRFS